MEAVIGAIASPVILISIGVAAIVNFTLYKLYGLLVSPYHVLSRHGIRGPKPLPIVGNYHTIRKDGRYKFLEEQMNTFGPVFGYYIGAQPKIAITDVELAKEIMVKEFDSFGDRGMIGAANILPKALGLSQGLVVATGETWKIGRHTLTPSFSGMKMKLMVPLLKRSSDVLLAKVGEFSESDESVDVFKMYGAFTMETLIATAFGRYVNIQRGEADQLTDAANVVFRASGEGSPQAPDILIATLSNFPWIEPLVQHALRNSKPAAAVKVLHSTANGLIKARMESKQPPKVKDLLQLMIDAAVDDEDSEQSSTKKLTSEQIAGFSLDFLLAGYETTANTLTYTTYLLATHPDVQEKLQAEIDQYFEEVPEVSLYEAAQKLQYLQMVIHESMRLYTPIPKTQRQCHKTITVGDLTIPKGTNVVIPMNVIHHMPQYWPDPYKFDPERFTPEAKANRPQLAHMPFGWGPRNCIGLRFALLEMKIALIEILRKYSFVCGPETVTELQQSHGITSVPLSRVLVKIAPRTN